MWQSPSNKHLLLVVQRSSVALRVVCYCQTEDFKKKKKVLLRLVADYGVRICAYFLARERPDPGLATQQTLFQFLSCLLAGVGEHFDCDRLVKSATVHLPSGQPAANCPAA